MTNLRAHRIEFHQMSRDEALETTRRAVTQYDNIGIFHSYRFDRLDNDAGGWPFAATVILDLTRLTAFPKWQGDGDWCLAKKAYGREE